MCVWGEGGGGKEGGKKAEGSSEEQWASESDGSDVNSRILSARSARQRKSDT